MRRAAWLLATSLLGGLAVSGGWLVFTQPGPMPDAADIVVPHGSLAAVGIALRDNSVVGSALGFRLAALATRGEGPVHAAEFAFPAHASLRTVLTVLRTGHPVEHALTIPEGLTAAEIAGLVSRADALSGPVTVPPEGSILPQTYEFERGADRQTLLRRMQVAMRKTLDEVWQDRDPAAGLASPASLLVLASLVERETGVASERATVAAVFLRRLRLGMKLQSDPTAAYQAAGGLGSLARPLTRADLEAPGPTNTYVIAGLPAAPICAPGLASLQAAAHPARTDALYFVASGAGGHVFAASLPEHQHNVVRYREGSR